MCTQHTEKLYTSSIEVSGDASNIFTDLFTDPSRTVEVMTVYYRTLHTVIYDYATVEFLRRW